MTPLSQSCTAPARISLAEAEPSSMSITIRALVSEPEGEDVKFLS